ncbi:MAG: hypothetical protein ACREMP_04640 [Candidatus Tyrphobacter sp.]
MTQDAFYLQVAIWSQVASAILFVVALAYIWVHYLMPMVLAAQRRSNEQIAEAERHRDEAKAAIDLLQEDIESARHDAQRIAGRAERHAAREREAAIAQTRSAGARTIRNAHGEIERAREAGRVRLRSEIVAKALAAVRDAAQRRVDEAANKRLVHEFLSRVERTPR